MPVRTLGPKGVDLGAVPHRLEEGKSASEDAGPKGEGIVMSHIGLEGKPESESPPLADAF